MTTSSQLCPRCHAPLPPGRTEGICPKCLLEQGFQTSPPTVAPTTPGDRSNGRLPLFVAPAVEELAPHFPQLQLLELLGVGGMGAVYKARQATLDRTVALKILPREVGNDPAFAERFTREAKALARLNHPHIVTIHDIGQAGGLYYIVMEYIDGANLRQMMNTQTLTPQQALVLVPQLCEALQYAHDEGIVHRDIKPENILVDKRGRAKVADFGLAKLLGDEPLQSSLTASQQVMGTLRYMAPEQMMGAKDVDHRADLYALGVVFYELLTGDLPLGRFPLPSEKARCDARLDDVVLKALERERERRYQQAAELKTDVDAISSDYAPAAGTKPQASKTPTFSDEAEFEQASDDVRAPAWGMIGLCLVQLLILLTVGAVGYSMVEATIPGSQMMPGVRTDYFPRFVGLMLLLPIPLALLMLMGAVQMKRLRSYEFAVIGSLLAMIPIGPTCILTLPVGLWSLLVLMRPHVRRAFRTPLRQRPEAWREQDAELLTNREQDPAAADRALARVQSRCRTAAIAMLVASAFDLVGIAAIAALFATRSRGGPPWILMLLLVGVPLIVTLTTAWCARCLMLLRSWPASLAGAVLCILPLTPMWWLRWMAGVYATATVLRSDVQRAFAIARDDVTRHPVTKPHAQPRSVYAQSSEPDGL